MAENPASLIRGYLEFAERVVGGDRDAPQWAMAVLDALVRDEPDVAWSVIVQIVAGASDDRVLGFVAAGPLEDLLRGHGSRLMNQVEELANSDQKFRLALTGVWLSGPPEVSKRIEVLVAGVPRL